MIGATYKEAVRKAHDDLIAIRRGGPLRDEFLAAGRVYEREDAVLGWPKYKAAFDRFFTDTSETYFSAIRAANLLDDPAP